MDAQARYFDGRSSRAFPVVLRAEEGWLSVAHADARPPLKFASHEVRFLERTRHGPCIVELPHQGRLELDDAAAYQTLRAALGVQSGLVERLQQSWRAVLAVLLVTLAGLYGGYRWGVPAAAEAVAQAIPARWEAELGSASLGVIDRDFAKPTALPASRQAELRALFARLTAAEGVEARLEFRKFETGPNALALPGGTVILSDEMVALFDDDEALAGVLAHEVGHVKHRHALRGLLQAAALSSMATLLWGDVSGLAATLPALIGQFAYSREFERQADRFACDALRAQGLSSAGIAELFDRLGKKSDHSWLPAYASTHPPTPERVAYFTHCQHAVR